MSDIGEGSGIVCSVPGCDEPAVTWIDVEHAADTEDSGPAPIHHRAARCKQHLI